MELASWGGGGRTSLAAACHGIVRVLAGWQWWGVTAAGVAAAGVSWRCRGGGYATPARRRRRGVGDGEGGRRHR